MTWVLLNSDNDQLRAFHTHWNRLRLFLHTNLSTAKKNDICEGAESYHKLGKNYQLKDNSFDIWFSGNCVNLITFK
jgi:hypothetical protein